MRGLLHQADQVLRGAAPSGIRLIPAMVVFGLVYGVVMGSFGGLDGERLWQAIYSGVKVPVLLMTTFALSLPSFFVLNTLLGVRSDFGHAFRALFASQTALTVILSALAPLTLVWYLCSSGYRAAILFNAAMFTVASVGAQLALRRSYQPLIARNPRHRSLLRLWLGVYAFVGIQLGWVLRPFLGAPGQRVQFVREEAWDNAYVIVARMIWEVLGP